MPEPVSTIVSLIAGSTILCHLNRQNTSVSDGGNYVRIQANQFKNYSSSPVTLSTKRYSALSELDELIQECSQVGWDGEKAPAISLLTIENIKVFLASLPKDIPDPEFAPEPANGAISLEWYGGYRRIASVSINDSQRLAFAALQGTDVSNGAYKFSEGSLPSSVLSVIRDVLS